MSHINILMIYTHYPSNLIVFNALFMASILVAMEVLTIFLNRPISEPDGTNFDLFIFRPYERSFTTMTEAEATAYLPTKDGEGKAASGDGLDTRHGNGVSVDPFYAHARTAYRIYVPIKRCRKEGWAAGDMVRLVAGEKVAATHNMLVQNTACAQDQAEIPSCPAPTSLTSSPTIIARIWPTRHCPDEHGSVIIKCTLMDWFAKT